MKNNIVKLGGVLCLISAIAGGVLAFTNDFTKDKIAEVEAKASMDPAILEAVMPGSEIFEPYEDTALVESIKTDNTKFVDLMTAVDGSGNQLGYAIKTFSTISGYGGDIELFVGVSPEGKITGIAVTTIQETQGLGSKVAEPEFKNQFIDMDANAEIPDDGYDAITGATKSSVSFTSAVNNAINIYNQYLNK
ncbi:FMN-binding protein [Sedimentibacter sp. MB31-C6]|uniref:FMN-binding protein n=1 Tax=Sedimentibacter sp. MB31-C6 TaxID=3109366 RepID=UPI002DDCDDF3|nr:FMN-binding protein [Sedimentibacter sp. MB36-C1]WSI04368.1 FMN-binding protein [Sedimentibacter sp. MB36-C1]